MDSSKQKKSKETKAENNKPKIQNKKKEEQKKGLKKIISSNKNDPQKDNNRQRLNTIQNEHRKKFSEYLGDKTKESVKSNEKKNNTPKKFEKQKTLNNKIDNNDDDTLNRSTSFSIPYINEKQLSKKEEKVKENKNSIKITKKPLVKKKDKPLYKKSQEVEAIFNYNGTDTTIQIHSDEKMKDIIYKFAEKTGIKKDDVFFIYNGGQINENFSFTEQANDLDNNRKN